MILSSRDPIFTYVSPLQTYVLLCYIAGITNVNISHCNSERNHGGQHIKILLYL